MLVFKARPRKDPTLDAGLTESEKRLMRVFRDTRAEVQARFVKDRAEIMRLLLHAPVTQIVNAVPLQPWFDSQEDIEIELRSELVDAGKRITLPPIQKATLTFRFDDARPEAARWAAKESGALIQDITEGQLGFVRDVVSRSEMGDFTPREAARVFREMQDGLGLTTQQSEWVENFRSRTITDGIGRGLSLEAAESAAEKSTARYADRIYRYRTETIARTEILRASNEGRNQAWAQGVEGGWISPGSLKQWSTNVDDRTCQICLPLDGLTVRLGESFPEGDPPVHPMCRCTTVLSDEVPKDLTQMTDAQLEAEIDRLLDGTVSPTLTNTPEQILSNSRNILQAAEQASSGGDKVLAQVYEAKGYNTLPRVAPASEIDEAISKGATEVFRGIDARNANEYIDMYRYGDHFPGRGLYGNGTYTADTAERALEYGNGNAQQVMRIAIRPEAKRIDFYDAQKQWENDLLNMYEEKRAGMSRLTSRNATEKEIEEYLIDMGARSEVMSDVGRWATVNGYDVVIKKVSDAESYHIILNRGMVIVQDTNGVA